VQNESRTFIGRGGRKKNARLEPVEMFGSPGKCGKARDGLMGAWEFERNEKKKEALFVRVSQGEGKRGVEGVR